MQAINMGKMEATSCPWELLRALIHEFGETSCPCEQLRAPINSCTAFVAPGLLPLPALLPILVVTLHSRSVTWYVVLCCCEPARSRVFRTAICSLHRRPIFAAARVIGALPKAVAVAAIAIILPAAIASRRHVIRPHRGPSSRSIVKTLSCQF